MTKSTELDAASQLKANLCCAYEAYKLVPTGMMSAFRRSSTDKKTRIRIYEENIKMVVDRLGHEKNPIDLVAAYTTISKALPKRNGQFKKGILLAFRGTASPAKYTHPKAFCKDNHNIKTNRLKVYRRTMTPFLEIDKSQTVINIDGVIEQLYLCDIEQVQSFTFAIGLDGEVRFSLSASASYHWNLFGGRDVIGAGEVYLKRTYTQKITLAIINNRSGLYKPEASFFCELKDFFGAVDVDVSAVVFNDERQALMQAETERRFLMMR